MKLQYRFLLLLLLVVASVGVTLFIQHSFELERSQHILQSDLSQRQGRFKYYLSSEGRTFQTFSEDYSFWDDMVNFVKTDDVDFAHVNLDSGLSTFGADADWVYRPDGSLLYSSTADPSIVIGQLPLSKNFFTKLTTNKFEHFYLQLPTGVLEIRAATIVPGDDPGHHDAPAGFWVIGRYLNQDFTGSIGSLSQSTIQFEPASTPAHDAAVNNSVTFYEPLKDWQGHTVAYLQSTTKVSVISDLNAIYKRELLLLVIVGALMIILVSLAVWRLILNPIGTVALSIQRQQPELLDRLGASKSQLGQLARVVQEFFQQKLVIQEDKLKKEELEKLNKEKTEFLSLAAHELNGPITVTKLLAYDLDKTLHGTPNDNRVFNYTDLIKHQVDKMVMLITDLRFASQGKSEIVYQPVTFDFDTYLKKEVAGAQIITSQRLVVEGSTGAQIHADPARLSQVVSNLIKNASKYASGTEKIVIRSSAKPGEVVAEVEDFGKGIPPEAQAHIFDKYYRSPETARSVEGLGLGLAVCKEIIEHMGGKIWVESSPGNGTHMYFSLPVTSSLSTGQAVNGVSTDVRPRSSVTP